MARKPKKTYTQAQKLHYLTLWATTIVGLLLRRGPATVARLVVPLVVDAIQAHAIGLLAHVRKERHERAPRVADANTASAIRRPVAAVGVSTSRNHVAPRAVRAALPAMPRMSMHQRRRLPSGCLQAATRASVAAPQISSSDLDLATAGASTAPDSVRPSFPFLGRTFDFGDDRELPVLSADHESSVVQ